MVNSEESLLLHPLASHVLSNSLQIQTLMSMGFILFLLAALSTGFLSDNSPG